MSAKAIEFEGVDIQVSRSLSDGHIVIDISTEDLEGPDYPSFGFSSTMRDLRLLKMEDGGETDYIVVPPSNKRF